MRIKISPTSGRLPLRAAAIGAITTAVIGLLSGCAFSGGPGGSTTGTGSSGLTHISGTVYGGQQPVSGTTIQLYAVGTTGNGSASNPLIASTVTTNTNGQFNITGTYSCASATQVYIVATGGDAGSGVNSALSLMTALGPCSSLTSATNISINELTTVAAVYALAPFMTGYTQVGANGSNPTGLVNAFLEAQLLVNTSTGTLGTAPTGMTLPATELNTLADILASCVNSSGPTSSTCTTLLSATAATDTIGAGLAIAQAPGSSSMTALWSLPTGTPPFVPALSAQPNDFTVAVRYAGAELLGPYGIALDASGNAWVTNEAGSSVVKLPSLSSAFVTATYSNGGLLAPRGISIDRTGNIWIANTGGNDVVELNSSGAVLSGSGFTGGGISVPVAIANDSGGNAWVTNFAGNSITELGTNGTASGTSPITGSGALSEPTSIAIDSTGKVGVANASTGQLCLFNNSAVLQSCVSDNTLLGSTALAISSTGSASMAGSTTGPSLVGAFTLATSAGAVNSTSPGSGGGLTLPDAVAYDGNNIAWFANAGSIAAFSDSTAISPSSGFGSLSYPAGIAIDASGNVWTANTGDNSVSMFVGLATPVVTPIAANVGP